MKMKTIYAGLLVFAMTGYVQAAEPVGVTSTEGGAVQQVAPSERKVKWRLTLKPQSNAMYSSIGGGEAEVALVYGTDGKITGTLVNMKFPQCDGGPGEKNFSGKWNQASGTFETSTPDVQRCFLYLAGRITPDGKLENGQFSTMTGYKNLLNGSAELISMQ